MFSPRFSAMALAVVTIGVAGCTIPVAPSRAPTPDISWDWQSLPPLPPAPGQTVQIGVAGPFVGIVGRNLSETGALLVAGGANFPEAPPWRGGSKVWVDDVFILRRTKVGDEPHLRWETDEAYRLPRPLAYGVSVSTDAGVICIGGCDADACSRDVFLITWNPVTRRLATRSLAPLPRPLAFMAGALVGETVYVAGGQESMKDGRSTRNFFALDLSGMESGGGWRELEAWPGPPRVVPVAAAQTVAGRERFFLFSGRDAAPGRDTELLCDAWEYDPARAAWHRLADVSAGGAKPRSVMAGTAAPLGDGRIAVVGGDGGAVFRELEQLGQSLARADEGSRRHDRLKAKQVGVFEGHPGFSTEVLLYDPAKDAWASGGFFPTTSHVTTQAVVWDGAVVVPSGEVRPGVRTPAVWLGRPADGLRAGVR